MVRIGGSSCQSTPRKYAMARVPVEAMYILPKLNQVTCPFSFPIPRCDDAVKDIDTEEKYFFVVDMESGYW